MKVIKVRGKKEMREFVRLPQKIFEDHPCYVPPLWIDEMKGYCARTNPMLAAADFELLLVRDDDGKAVGRTIVYIDHKFNDYYQSNIGFFGAFECIDDAPAAGALIRTAEDWLKEKKVMTIRGPINPVAENWGFVLEGYNDSPVFMSPWNPPYYHAFFTNTGYGKVKDLLVYDADIKKGYTLPPRLDGFYEKFVKHYPGIRVRRLDMHRLKEDARSIWEISNIALADNWGFVPVELPVMEDMLRKLKLVVDPDAVWMAEYNGKAIGFCLGFPDINILLKKMGGKLFPFGWVQLLRGARKLQDYRLFGLAVHPDWQGKALDALMYVNLYKHLSGKRIRLEANYILEDNFRIKNALEKLNMQKIKTYRIYEKSLAETVQEE
ncbi:MAG: hypothetical protein JW780_04980 [Clostridiales bacterium]|nr:hypothetical protein [Clostridiales bacterium]